ncbi:MAG: cell wall hydrolase [Sphingomicrobium sp.]
MTAFALTHRRLAIRFGALRVETLALAFVMLVVAVATLFAFRAPAQEPGSAAARIRVPPAKAAALVAATSATASAAVGQEAALINASLPFSVTPIQAASPFAIAGDDTDHRRALLCLTQAVYYEAGFEPIAGRRAVAQVVLNRMRHPAFPKSVCGVVYQGSRSPVCQFSFVCDGSLYRAPALGAWRQSQDIARAALGGYVESSVGAATHYHANYVSPRWAPMLAKITQLGAHIFYRWPGAWGQRGAFTGRYVGEPQDPLSLRPALRQAQIATLDGQAAGFVQSGPPIARAPNDVGGLLDVSKGWTLNIPDPTDTGKAAARAMAAQETKLVAPAAAAADVAPRVIASR